MTDKAIGTFEVAMTPQDSELDGAVNRLGLAKTWFGDIDGVGTGVMLSGGDPSGGTAGYVAMETVTGRLGDRSGTFAMQQYGTMISGSTTQYYEVVPGSGTGELAGLTGRLRLDIDADGTHRYELSYELGRP